MEKGIFQPSLDGIQEASIESDTINIDYIIATEYANITTEDLLKALDIDNEDPDDSMSASFYKYGDNPFSEIHSNMHYTNKTLIDQTISSRTNSISGGSKLSSVPVHDSDDTCSLNTNCSLYTTGSITSSVEGIDDTTLIQTKLDGDQQCFTGPNDSTSIPMMFGCDFDSDEGKKLFAKAINGKYMHVYYLYTKAIVLSSGYDNERNEFSMMLNVLKINFTDQDKLETMEEFIFSTVGQVHVSVTYIHQFSSVKEFRLAVKTCCRGKDSAMCCFFKSAMYGLLLVVGYLKEKDVVLLLHQNKFSWVSISSLWLTLQGAKEDDVLYSGGYVVLNNSYDEKFKNSLKLTLAKDVSITLDIDIFRNHNLAYLISTLDAWDAWLDLTEENPDEDIVVNACLFLLSIIDKHGDNHNKSNDNNNISSQSSNSRNENDNVFAWITGSSIYQIWLKFKQEVEIFTQEDTKMMKIFCNQLIDLFQVTSSKGRHKFRKRIAKPRDVKYNYEVVMTSFILFSVVNKNTLLRYSNASALLNRVQADIDKLSSNSMRAMKNMFGLIMHSVQWLSVLDRKNQELLEQGEHLSDVVSSSITS